jgi:predicted dehydrogenase
VSFRVFRGQNLFLGDNDMIKAGFIGTGGISGVHLRYLKTRKDVKIAALCDVNKENLTKRLGEFGGQGFSDFRKMLREVELDAVWICTPPQVRGEPLLACADLGIPVFCEKPVERSVQKAEKIAAELKRRKAHVQVGYVLRSMSAVRRLCKEMKDDKIHLVQSFYGCNVSLNMGLKPWFYDKKISGGALVDQATHNLDLLRMLIGEVAEVRGLASNPVRRKKNGYTIDEVIGLSLLFEDGTVGSHVHTWVGDAWRNEIVMVGEKRTYRLNVFANTLTIDERGKTRVSPPDKSPIHYNQNVMFLKMVKSGNWRDIPSDYADGLRTLKLTVECDKAIGSTNRRP